MRGNLLKILKTTRVSQHWSCTLHSEQGIWLTYAYKHSHNRCFCCALIYSLICHLPFTISEFHIGNSFKIKLICWCGFRFTTSAKHLLFRRPTSDRCVQRVTVAMWQRFRGDTNQDENLAGENIVCALCDYDREHRRWNQPCSLECENLGRENLQRSWPRSQEPVQS